MIENDWPPTLAPLLQAAEDLPAAVRRAAAAGARVLGLQCADLPEELPHALGLHPFRLALAPQPPQLSQAFLQTFCCSWVQSLLDQALRGELAHLWGVTFSCNTCDSIQNLPDIWRRTVRQPAAEQLYALRLPVLLGGEAARELLQAELAGWQSWLEERTGRALVPARLEASARLYNRLRGAQRRLAALAREGRAPYSLLQAALLGAQAIDRSQAADCLEAALPALAARPVAPAAVRVLLVGGILDQPILLRFLEEHGAHVVGDDSCTLSRVLEPAMDVAPEDPLDDLSRRHLRRAACPVRSGSAARRGTALQDLTAVTRAQGVIFLPHQGCEPHAFDNVLLARALDERSLPHLTLEIDPHLGSWGGLTTRLEAFLELCADPLEG